MSVSCGGAESSVKGEKSKVEAVGGAASDCDGDRSSSEDQVCAGARQCLTKEKLEGFCRHLGDGRGECCIVVLL